MATVHHVPAHEAPGRDGIFADLTRLLQLELELGLTETRRLIVSVVIALAVAVPAGIALIASVVMLLAAALAPLFHARWEHLLVAGGVVFLLALAALAWSVWRVRSLGWPRQTLTSFEENWRWLGAQLRSRLTLR